MNSERPDFMSGISDGFREFKETSESAPHVGLFYVINGKLYWEGVSTAHVEGTEYFKAYPKKYTTYWNDNILRRLPALKQYDAFHFPRGRVMFDRKKDTYELIADKCILENSALMKKIVSEMRLPEQKVQTSWDINCECAECKKFKSQIHSRDGLYFKTTRDGRKLFFPLGKGSTRLGLRGYVVPSYEKYQRLRSGLAYWRRSALFVNSIGFVIFNYTHDKTGSLWRGVIAMLFFTVPFLIGHWVWLRNQYRGWKQTDSG